MKEYIAVFSKGEMTRDEMREESERRARMFGALDTGDVEFIETKCDDGFEIVIASVEADIETINFTPTIQAQSSGKSSWLPVGRMVRRKRAGAHL